MPKINEDKNTRNDWVEYQKDLWIKENWKDFRDADIEQLFFDFTLEEIKDEYNVPEELENENQIKEWLEQNVFNFEYYNSYRESWEDIAENEILNEVDKKYQNLLNIFYDCCWAVCEKINDKLIDGIEIDYEITSSHSWNKGRWPSQYAIFTFKIDYNKITDDDIIEDLESFNFEVRFSDGHYNGQDYGFEIDWTDYLRDADVSKDEWIKEIYNQVCNCIDYKICDSEAIFIENSISENFNNQINYLLNESKQDIDAFINKFGQDTYDEFKKSTQRLKNSGYSTDIIKYTKDDSWTKEKLDKLLFNLSNKLTVSKDDSTEIEGEYRDLGVQGNYHIYEPLDALASMNLGVGSGWCTAGRYGHYGDKNFKPSLKDAKHHWDSYTSQGIRFFYYLDKDTNLAKYAIAVYPELLDVDTLVGENYISRANFEIYDAKDSPNRDAFDKLPTNNLGVELTWEALLKDSNVIYTVVNNIKTKIAEIKGDTLYIEDGVKEINNSSDELNEIIEEIKSIIIPNSVEKIGYYAFYRCKSLESITIPNSVKEIGVSAFEWCVSLKSITIPNGVEKIGDFAFSWCKSLESITIPNSVKEIGDFAFYRCSDLTIYCEEKSQPKGWTKYWNSDNRPVVWGYKNNKVSEELDDKALSANLDTNSIISLLSNTFGTTDEPQPTAMYLLPNGRFLFTSPLEPSDDCDYEIDEHRNIDDFLYHKDIIEDDRYLEDDGSLFAENVLNFIRFNITDDYYGDYSYIQLNQKQPTSQQYDSLLKIFDCVINHKYKYISIIFDTQYGKQVKLELNNYTSDELIKKIKRFYVSGILTENKNKQLATAQIINNKNIDTANKINYNKIEEDMNMEKEIHLKDILDKKDIDIIYVYNDIKDAHFNLTDSLEEDTDTDVFNELDMLSMSNENLLNLSEEQLHQIDNLELLDRIAKLDSTKLSTAQLKKLRKAYKEKVIIKEEDVKQLLEQLKQCDRLFITPAPKNNNFLKEHNLYVKECLEILHQLEVADYCASTKSINLNNLGHDLIIFEKDSVTLKDNQKLGPLIIYIKLDLTGLSDSIVVAVSFHEALGLNKQPYYKQIDKSKKETNSIVHKHSSYKSLNKDIEKHDTKLKESMVIKEPSFEHSYQYGRVWTTSSASEMKNAILGSSTVLRILYDTKHRFYVYANAEDYIHRELLEIAWEFGLYPEYTQRWQFQEGHFEDHTVQLLYAPKNKVKDTWGANIMEDGYTDRIEYDFGVITGRTDRASADYLFLDKIPLIKSLKSLEIKHTYFSEWSGDEPIIKEVSANTNEQFNEDRINNDEGLDEDIEKHNTLNPLLFDENETCAIDINESSKYDSPKKLLKECGKFIYHVTDKKHLKSIFEKGLENFWFSPDANLCFDFMTYNHSDYNDLCLIEISTKQLEPSLCDFTVDVGNGVDDEWGATGVYKGNIKIFHNIYDEDEEEMSNDELNKYIKTNNIIFESLTEEIDRKDLEETVVTETIEKHDTLNPLLFDENDELKPEIKKAISKIVNQFIEGLKEDGIKITLKDVILVGSNVSYNYTKDSDLDVHLIVDGKTLDCSPELYALLYGAYRSLFNKNYDITIKGIPVEIYVELE